MFDFAFRNRLRALTSHLRGAPPSRKKTRRRPSGPLAVEHLEDRTVPSTFVVSTTADTQDANPGDGLAQDSNGNTSLRAAFMEANALAGADTIVVPAGTYRLSLAGTSENAARTGDLDVTDSAGLTVVGDGAASTAIDAQQLDRLFDVQSFAGLTLQGVTLQNGFSTSNGGAIANRGQLTVEDSTLTLNYADIRGGAIDNDSGTVTLTNSALTRNTAGQFNTPSNGLGGALNSFGGRVTITGCTLTNNTAAAQGGAVATTNTTTIQDSTFDSNTAKNTAGAVYLNAGGTLTATGSTFSNNQVTAAAGQAGAVYVYITSSATFTNCTVSDNTVGGASPLSFAAGGGFYDLGTLKLVNTTVAGNKAGTGGGVWRATSASFVILNSLIALNAANDQFSTDISGNVTSLGGNLVGNAFATFGFRSTDLIGDELPIDPLLGPLQDNGGPTKTRALLSGSPAIDIGLSTSPDSTLPVPAADQRGDPRPAGAGVDVGAFELEPSPTDHPPVANPDSYTVSKNNPLTVSASGVLGNDTDADGDALTAVLVAGPAHGALTLNGDGSFTYAPASGYVGDDSFTYQASDGSLDSNTVTVTLTVSDDAPVANGESYAVSKNNPLTVAAAGVLGNDTDANGDALTAVLVSGPAHGTLALSAGGGFTYTPAADYTGADSFTYKANDGQLNSAAATVSLTVSDDAPVANSDSFGVSKNNPLTVAAAGVLGNDTDANGDALTAVLVSGPAHGTLALNGDGSFTYAPAAGYTGGDSFSYQANDGQLDSAAATVSLTVSDDAPVANADSYAVSKNNPLTVAAAGVLGNDTDANGDALTAVLVSGPAHGTLALNADGSFTYAPAVGYTGGDSFTYQASDGSLDSNVATVSLSITDDAPVANADSYAVSKNNPLTVAALGVLDNDTDANGDALTAVLVSGPAHGTLALNADGSFTYTPAAGYTGGDSFSYQANDGQLDSAAATVSLTVSNDAPAAANDSFSITQGSPLTVTAPGLLANDTDPNRDPLTASLVSGPANGTLKLNADGSFTYTPNSDFAGTDTFTYRASDGTAVSNLATVTISVAPANTPGATLQPDPLDPDQVALVVRGTSGDDRIDVKSTGNSGQIQVSIRSATYNFSRTYPATFSRLIVYGLAGDDRIMVQSTVKVPALLFGGDGDDEVQAGGGPTALVGGDGNDHLQGGPGRDVLIGGRGSDHLTSGDGDDVLIAGFTDHDAHLRDLCAILDAWNGTGSYASRVAGLGALLSTSTVHDDGVEDHLGGGGGTDWFFAALSEGANRKKDQLSGAHAGDTITDISLS
jgi:VCBS repeat-containing protein